jgi:hypothetical protein
VGGWDASGSGLGGIRSRQQANSGHTALSNRGQSPLLTGADHAAWATAGCSERVHVIAAKSRKYCFAPAFLQTGLRVLEQRDGPSLQ